MISLAADKLALLGEASAIRLVRLWQITRKDNVQIRLTDHDRETWFKAQDYDPIDAFAASSKDKETGVKPHWTEGRGIVSSSKITEKDLWGHRYDDAVVVEYLIDWRYPWVGELFSERYKIHSIEWNGEAWEAELAGFPQDLEARTGTEYQSRCRFQVGDPIVGNVANCDVDLAALGHVHSGIITTFIDNDRQVFGVSIVGAQSEHYFDFGKITITDPGSPNYLITEDIAYSEGGLDLGGGNYEHRITLGQALQFPITAGITVSVVAGCDGLPLTCSGKFNNRVNFGAQDYVPGSDKIFELPK